MRFSFLVAVILLAGCGSDDDAGPVDSGPNACVASGAVCAPNFPFFCPPGYEEVSDSTRKTACGKSVGSDPRDVACCVPSSEPTDTGTKDTGSADTGSSDASSDGTVDASTSETATDAPADG